MFFVNVRVKIPLYLLSMHLEKIEIQGFKSFAQKTTIEFPQPHKADYGITCIVGPNGSGKSNIVDSVRWVLGEQSIKSLRGKRSEDVIFSGSEQKARLGLAQVSLYINNEDGKMPVDYKEVVISRKLHRNGESEYSINKSKVRLQDVIMNLAKANFGQKSYSIVSQGSIDQVIMASSSDRKEYFDEAVGVKEFQLKRDQSLNKLESAWNNLRQVDALLTEITPRLNSLTRQVKRLERREKVEAELKERSEKYYGWLWHEENRKIKEVKPKLELSEKELADKQKDLRLLQDHLRSMEKQDSRSKVFGELQEKYQKVLGQKSQLREEQLVLQNKIELATQRLVEKAVPLALSEIIAKLKEIEKVEHQLFANIEKKDLASLAQAKEDSLELRRLIKDLVDQLENPKIKEKVKAEIDETLTKDLKAVEKDLGAIEGQLVQASADMNAFNQSEEQQKGKFFEIQRQITSKQDEYNKLASSTSELRVEIAKLETHQQDLKQEIKEEMQNIAWLDAYKASPINQEELHSEVVKLRHQLELIGGVDPEIVKEYKETKERHDFLSEQAEDLRNSIKSLEKVINELDDKIQLQFDTAFKNINKQFEHFFKILFGGGKAALLLVKEENRPEEEQKPDVSNQISEGSTEEEEKEESKPGILEQMSKVDEQMSPKRFLKKRTGKVITGIDIIATPPGKKVSYINMLSGGERSLASIALICAVIFNNPSPFVILDEVDAALDESNSQRFAKILTELAHKTQFVVITHNRATMYVSSVLYGVSMGNDGVSKLLGLKLEEAERVVRQ